MGTRRVALTVQEAKQKLRIRAASQGLTFKKQPVIAGKSVHWAFVSCFGNRVSTSMPLKDWRQAIANSNVDSHIDTDNF